MSKLTASYLLQWPRWKGGGLLTGMRRAGEVRIQMEAVI